MDTFHAVTKSMSHARMSSEAAVTYAKDADVFLILIHKLD